MASVALHSLSTLENLPPDDPASLIIGRDAAVTRIAHHAQEPDYKVAVFPVGASLILAGVGGDCGRIIH